MMFSRLPAIATLVLPLCITACVAPTQQTPNLDPNAVARERELQQQIINQQGGKPVMANLSTQEITSRMQNVANRIGPAGQQVCQQMYGNKQNCTFKFQLAKEGPVNAYADGTNIVVTPAMVAFASSEQELAMVVAHEYAHNVLKHPQATGVNAAGGGIAGTLIDALANSQGYDTGGTFGKMGQQYGQFRYSVDFEKEADYVGMYILDRAGYDVSNSPDFWRRMSALNPDGIYGGKSHPGNAERYVAMNQTTAEIAAKKRAGQQPLPERKPKKDGFGFGF